MPAAGSVLADRAERRTIDWEAIRESHDQRDERTLDGEIPRISKGAGGAAQQRSACA